MVCRVARLEIILAESDKSREHEGRALVVRE
jgi:hypothetical protein